MADIPWGDILEAAEGIAGTITAGVVASNQAAHGGGGSAPPPATPPPAPVYSSSGTTRPGATGPKMTGGLVDQITATLAKPGPLGVSYGTWGVLAAGAGVVYVFGSPLRWLR